jgi:quinol monooxygenase YgiN
MHRNQPGVVLKMKAKPGKGDALFELTNSLHHTGDDPDGPVNWALRRADDDPDILWAFEFYRDDESFTRHYSDTSRDDGHNQVIDLLAEMPLRVDVHTYARRRADRPSRARRQELTELGMHW